MQRQNKLNYLRKTFLVAGGTSGIGRETVGLLHSSGAKLIVLSRNPVEHGFTDRYTHIQWDAEKSEMPNMDEGLSDGLVYAPGKCFM